jgi:hypothetical protein
MIEEENIRDAGTSKNEVFAAYHELLRKLKETQKTPATQVVQEEKIIEEKKHIVEVAVKETVTNDLARHLINLRNSLNESLNDVENELLRERKKLSNAKDAYDIITNKLKDLYEIEPAADTLAALLMAHQEKSISLDHEITQRKAHWKKEQEEFETALRDHQAQVKAEQQREEEDFLYKRDIMRQKEQDQFDAAKRNMENELTMKRLQAEDEFRLREARIAAREFEIESFKDKIEKFPEEIERAVADAERNISDKLFIKFEYELKLAEKDFDNERKALQQTIATYQAEIEHMKSRNYSFKSSSFNPQNSPEDKLY